MNAQTLQVVEDGTDIYRRESDGDWVRIVQSLAAGSVYRDWSALQDERYSYCTVVPSDGSAKGSGIRQSISPL